MAFSFHKKLGELGERIACEEYLQRGYVLVARNIYNHRGKQMGEIDLIMRTEKELVFVEVKTRQGNKFGTGAEAVTKSKQRKLITVISWFSRRFPQYKYLQPRIDVCVVEIAPTFSPADQLGDLDKSRVNVIIIPDAVTTDY